MHEPRILNDFEHYALVYKPPGWFVHSPADKRAQKVFKDKIMTHWFMRIHRKKYYPIHRLDFGTEGLLLWAKSSEAAHSLSELNEAGGVLKTYHAVARGFFEPRDGMINQPLVSDHSIDEKECLTEYSTKSQIELPVQINSKFKSSRYSFMQIKLHTGRWHQIRRHFDQVAHPIIGDQEHGDSHHNRYFRDELLIPGLLLRAYSLRWNDPFSGEDHHFFAPETDRWLAVQSLFEESANLVSEGKA